MANPEHVALVKKSTEAMVTWRKSHPDTRLDLRRANLTHADLTGADLIGADLTGADLTGADLTGADLTRAHLWSAGLQSADLRGVHLMRADMFGADLRGADLTGADLRGADLADADLAGAHLMRAHLMRADLADADLTDADLADADLADANLTGADLTGANLTGADLTRAGLMRAHLMRAHLTGAGLTRANLTGADLTDADLTGANIGWTTLADLDLADTTGLAEVYHAAPSSVGVDTLARTLRSSGGRFTDEQRAFFSGAGVSGTLLEYLPSILESNPLQFYSCFISYSTRDDAFASALHDDLEKMGVKTWKWDLDGVVGRDLMENVDRAIRYYDKMILVCSEHSLASKGVDKEIVKALQKEEQLWNTKRRLEQEARAGEEPPFVDVDVLVPVWLDDSVEHWESSHASEVKRKMAADFRGVTPGSKEYQQELAKLIHALNPKSWPPKPPRSPR